MWEHMNMTNEWWAWTIKMENNIEWTKKKWCEIILIMNNDLIEHGKRMLAALLRLNDQSKKSIDRAEPAKYNELQTLNSALGQSISY